MHVASKLTSFAFAIALLLLSASAVHADGGNSVPCGQNKMIGCVLTTLDGVNVYFNGWDPSADQGAYDYGYRWQCVELVQRYYAEKFGYPDIWAPLYAYQTFDDWGHPSSMAAFPNGSSTTPQKGDVLVFDQTWADPYGHVALVKSVDHGKIDFVEQNVFDIGEDSLPIDSHNVITSEGLYGPVRGWLRDKTTLVTPPAALALVQEEHVDLGVEWLAQFNVTANGNWRLELDGQSVTGNSNYQSPWVSLAVGEHTVKFYGNPQSNAHLSWSAEPVNQ